MKKYELIKTDMIVNFLGTTLFRIRKTESKKLGGYIEKESNLSQDGDAWVCGDARVYGDARVCGDAWVCGDAQVFGDARVSGNAQVFGDARVYGNARVYGDAQVFGDARVCGDAQVFGDAQVCGDAQIEKYNQIVNVTNLQFNCTVTSQNVAIGCHLFNHNEIKKVTKKQALGFGLSLDTYKLLKILIPLLIRQVTK